MTRIGLFSRFAFSNASSPLMKTSKKAANKAAFLKLRCKMLKKVNLCPPCFIQTSICMAMSFLEEHWLGL